MHSKNSGFTIIEAMLAAIIVAMMLTPLLSIENFSIRSIGKAHNKINHYLFAQDFMMQARREQAPNAQSYTASKKEEPNTVHTYELLTIPSDSSLHTQENLLLERVKIQSSDNKDLTYLVNFIFKQPK